MVTTFNDLLVREGIEPSKVRLLRHRTNPVGGGRTLFDLWRDDRPGFELYQRTQSPEKALFRSGSIWAAFVSPHKERTVFAGLYDARFIERRAVDWLCPYRGEKPGGGAPVDVFDTMLRDELREQIGHLEIEWPVENVRSWVRYAEGANFPAIEHTVLQTQNSLPTNQELIDAFTQAGFERYHTTSKVAGLRREGVPLYVKLTTERRPIVLHPRYFDKADEIEKIEGISFDRPLRPYVNSNMRDLALYSVPHRNSGSRYGLAISAEPRSIPALADLLIAGRSIEVLGVEVRVVDTTDDPLTERERLAAARIGQGRFRQDLINLWNAKCPITGIDHLKLLRASHIKPWRSASNFERLDPYNGLLLSTHIDALFDNGLISFEDDGRMLVSSALGTENAVRMGLLQKQELQGLTAQHAHYLSHHRAKVFIA